MKRIFLTGASGCIGHYLAELLIQTTNHELFLLVRNPAKLQLDLTTRPGITLLTADLRDRKQYRHLLPTMDVVILAATLWGGEATYEVNVAVTLDLLQSLDPERCEQVIYFSTASILNRQNQLLREAYELGSDYIRSKYECYTHLPDLVIAPKITAVFPTLVFGGDAQKPYSHLSAGLAEVVQWMGLVRWFKTDGAFHFIHARDIALVVGHLVQYPPGGNQGIQPMVIGNPALHVNRAIAEICAYLGRRIYLRIPLSLWLANVFIKVFRIQMDPWSRFALNYRYFTHQHPVHPQMLGLNAYCPTVADLLKVSGIPGQRIQSP